MADQAENIPENIPENSVEIGGWVLDPRAVGPDVPVLPNRLQRLAGELADEGVPALEGAADPIAALVELAYALRPKVHEGRASPYGVILPPAPLDIAQLDGVGRTSFHLVPTHDLDLGLARRFADGVTSFAVRSSDSISHLACFGRNMADEYDMVGLQAALGGLIVQRHPSGQVRVFGPAGVVRWDGINWHHDAPLDAWLERLSAVAGDLPVESVRPLLRFAIHELGGRRIGATLIWRPTGHEPPEHRLEPLVHHAPRLRLDNIGEEAAIAQALAQTDGAAIFDADASLVALGVRLAPSDESREAIDALRGMRHTSAVRYSNDDPHAVVIVVSEDGPVTLMHRGEAITAADPGEQQIG